MLNERLANRVMLESKERYRLGMHDTHPKDTDVQYRYTNVGTR